jgi:hypothetical protein
VEERELEEEDRGAGGEDGAGRLTNRVVTGRQFLQMQSREKCKGKTVHFSGMKLILIYSVAFNQMFTRCYLTDKTKIFLAINLKFSTND